MPFYRFHVDANVPPKIVAERIGAVVGKGSFLEFTSWWSPDPAGRPFKGTSNSNSFKVRRYISYRNSFLPVVWGRLIPTSTGTRVNVTMIVHPFVALFMGFWLVGVGWLAIARPSLPMPWGVLPWGFLVFGIVLTAGGFFPEAIKAKRLIAEVVQNVTSSTLQQQSRL
ncbi:MAG TPA: hypothetical protein VKW06_14575 [Candidatus Angelobacter sp.]|nr:hypothetical protein [Candidatus Angelobacter sp.]